MAIASKDLHLYKYIYIFWEGWQGEFFRLIPGPGAY
jgi:hypothetical protein